MSEKRQRRPATKRGPKSSNPKPSAAALVPEVAEGQSAVGAALEELFNSIVRAAVGNASAQRQPAQGVAEGQSGERIAREKLHDAVFNYALVRDEDEERARREGAGTPPPTEGNGGMPPALRKLFDAIFEYIIERDEDEVKARALAARPKAEIIPFPKARS